MMPINTRKLGLRLFLLALLLSLSCMGRAQTWQLLTDDSFTRSDTVSGPANSITGAGHNWQDVNGSVFSISGNKLHDVPDSGNSSTFRRDFLLRPTLENVRDQRLVADLPAVTTATNVPAYHCVLRWQDANNCYLATISNYSSTGVASINIFSIVNVTLTGLLSTTTQALTTGHTYQIDASAVGASPTTLTLKLTDTTSSTLLKTITVTDASVGSNGTSMQAAGRIGVAAGWTGSLTAGDWTRLRTYYNNATGMTPSATELTAGTSPSITFTGSSTTWSAGTPGTPAFTLTNAAASASISSQSVASTTSASITIAAGSASGSFLVSDPVSGAKTVLYTLAPGLSTSVTTLPVSTVGNSVPVVGTNVTWSAGTPGTPTFTVSGLSGCSLTAQTVTDANHATLTITTGSTPGTLTITDSGSGATTSILIVATYAVNNANIFFSPYSWNISGSAYAQCANCGPYFKTIFNGTSCLLNVDVSNLTGGSVAASFYPTLRYSIDGGTFTDLQLTSATTQITLTSGLTSGAHTLYCVVNNEGSVYDRWTTPVMCTRITGLVADGTISAPTLQSKRLLVYWDSIGEGYQASGTDTGTAPGSTNATGSSVPAIAYALGAEYGAVCCSGSGWTVTALNWPPLFTPGNDTASSWNKYSAGASRLAGGLLSPAPDYIVVVDGTNDTSASDATVTAALSGWLSAVRAAAPNAQIFVVIPLRQTKVSAITAGFNAYQTSTPDAKAYLINLGSAIGTGLTGGSLTSSANSVDGIHPREFYNTTIAGAIVQAMQARLSRRFLER
jgi:lysophospholipase L1-like esterase